MSLSLEDYTSISFSFRVLFWIFKLKDLIRKNKYIYPKSIFCKFLNVKFKRNSNTIIYV